MFVGGTYRPEGRRQRLFTKPRRRSGRGWMVFAVIVVFVGFAWLWAFQRGPDATGVPTIKADNQPTRKKPDDPGGLKVVDIDPLAERTAPNVAKVMPPPESPLPKPQVEAAPAPQTPSAAPDAAPPQAMNPIQVAADGAVGPPLQLVPSNQKPAAAPAPTTPPQTPTKPTPAATAPSQPAPPAATPAPAPAPTQAAVTPKPVPAPETAKMAPPPPLAPGEKGFRVQLASVKSEEQAKDTWATLKRAHTDILGSLNFSVMTADLGDRGTFYRIMVGPMSQAAATQICDALKKQGAACILAKS